MPNTEGLNTQTANHLGIGVFRYQLEPAGKFVRTNAALARIFGMPSQQALEGKPLDDLFPDVRERDRFYRELERSGRVEFFEIPVKGKRGKQEWAAVTARISNNGNKEKYLEGIVQDISSFHDEQERLTHEIDALQGFLDSMPDAIYFKDKKNRLTKVNRYYAQGFGGDPRELIGRTDFDFFPEDQARQMFEDDNSVLKTGKPIIGKIERTLLPNGTWNQVITTKIPMVDRYGKITGTMGITRDMTAHANFEKERFEMVRNALAVLGKALEMRDPYTYTHTCHVAKIAQTIGMALQFDENRMMQLKLAAELHDLGKISVPLDILIKPGKLSSLEMSLVRQHVENCHSLIKGIEFPFPLAEIVYQHHERLDGSGYPRQIKGDDILLEARILAVSDVLESMTSHRPYREALGIRKAMAELEKNSGIQYDSLVVKAVVKLVRKCDGKPFWKNQDEPPSF